MRRMGYALLLSSVLASSASCRSPVDVDAQFHASIVRDSMRLENETLRPVYFFIIDAEIAPLANWTLCTEPAECASVAPGESLMVGRDDVGIGTDSKTVIVYWWRLVKSGDGYEPDAIRTTNVHWPARER